MTCIVALRQGNSVFIGGDAASVGGLSRDVVTTLKVFEKDGLVLGSSGSWRDIQVLKYRCDFPKFFPGSDPDEYIFNVALDVIRPALREAGSVSVKDGIETVESNTIVNFQGRIYVIYGNFAVLTAAVPYAAVGSGTDLAMGAFFATQDMPSAQDRVRIALEASAAHNARCLWSVHDPEI